MTFLPSLSSSLDLESSECEDVFAFPKIYGIKGSQTEYYGFFNVEYNAQSDRTAVSII
jgi:hypothetical protein